MLTFYVKTFYVNVVKIEITLMYDKAILWNVGNTNSICERFPNCSPIVLKRFLFDFFFSSKDGLRMHHTRNICLLWQANIITSTVRFYTYSNSFGTLIFIFESDLQHPLIIVYILSFIKTYYVAYILTTRLHILYYDINLNAWASHVREI